MAGHARSRRKEPADSDPHVDVLDALDRHEKLLTEISKHLETLVRLTTKERRGSPHLTIAEAGVYLGVAADTIKRKMKRGDIPYHRRPGTAPYFLKHELNAWLSDPGALCPATATPAENQETQDDTSENTPFDEEAIQRFIDRADFPTRQTEDPGASR